MGDMSWVTRAQRIADEVLFPSAAMVEREDGVLAKHLDLLASEGFYGLPAPVEYGGLGRDSFPALADVIAALAGGCLTTTFVWLSIWPPSWRSPRSPNPATGNNGWGRWPGGRSAPAW